MEKDKLSKSLEDYLEAIYMVAEKKKIVRVKDLIKMLDVNTASVIVFSGEVIIVSSFTSLFSFSLTGIIDVESLSLLISMVLRE